MYMLGKITYFDTALSLFMFCIASDLVCTFENITYLLFLNLFSLILKF